MSYEPIRIYGFLSAAPDSMAHALARGFDLTELDYKDGDLTLEFEGKYFFLDDLMEAIAPHLRPETTGRLDYIDHDEWTMTRFKFKDGAYTMVKVNLNDVLERYSHE
ncbi:MAG: hypothetical protein AB7E47_10160 [Desulfovibrionaceae bacterium]